MFSSDWTQCKNKQDSITFFKMKLCTKNAFIEKPCYTVNFWKLTFYFREVEMRTAGSHHRERPVELSEYLHQKVSCIIRRIIWKKVTYLKIFAYRNVSTLVLQGIVVCFYRTLEIFSKNSDRFHSFSKSWYELFHPSWANSTWKLHFYHQTQRQNCDGNLKVLICVKIILLSFL